MNTDPTAIPTLQSADDGVSIVMEKRKDDIMTQDQVTAVIAGLGDRGYDVYGHYQFVAPDDFKVVAVADPDVKKLKRAQEVFELDDDALFTDADDLFAVDKLADVAVVATQDRQHVGHASAAMRQGYHIICEKPISPSAAECIELANVARETERIVAIGHVLRYTPFYSKLRELIESGVIGHVERIQAAEHVGYFHQAHSFVRGNWRSSAETSPMILAKCCHDFDIFIWLLGQDCVRVSSMGSLQVFREERAPAGSGTRCLVDCAPEVKAACPFDAEKIYITNPGTGVRAIRARGGDTARAWPASVVSPTEVTEEAVRVRLLDGPYGRCVYRCDNDVVDRQVVNLEFPDGVTVNFEMSAFSAEVERTIHISGTHGEIKGNMEKNELILTEYGKEPVRVPTNEGDMSGHGGGDNRLVADFVSAVREAKLAEAADDGQPVISEAQLRTGIERSIQSHLIALAAEESRVNGGAPVALSEFAANCVSS